MAKRTILLAGGGGIVATAFLGNAQHRASNTAHQLSSRPKQAIVIGGGAAGIATAYALGLRGVRVTVLDASHMIASECSLAAAGGMQRSNPRVDAATWRKTMHSWASSLLGLSKTLQTFHIDLKQTLLDLHFWRWLYVFTKASFWEDALDKAYKQTELLKFTDWAITNMLDTMVLYPQLAQTACLSQDGVLKLVYNPDEATPEHQCTDSGLEPFQLLSMNGATKLCPTLNDCRPPAEVVAVVHQHQAAHASCTAYIRTLADICTSRLGVTIKPNTTVSGFTTDGESRITAIHLVNGQSLTIDNDTAVVLAAGSWTPLLAAKLNVFVPVYPMKGYSLVADVAGAIAGSLSHVVIEPKQNLYFTRYGSQLRVASIGEFAGWSTRPNPQIVHDLKAAASSFLPQLQPAWSCSEVVCGLRPFVADGAPLIGRLGSYNNVYVNVGPGFNGWKLAVGTGEVTARLVVEDTDALPFDVAVLSPVGRLG